MREWEYLGRAPSNIWLSRSILGRPIALSLLLISSQVSVCYVAQMTLDLLTQLPDVIPDIYRVSHWPKQEANMSEEKVPSLLQYGDTLDVTHPDRFNSASTLIVLFT